MSKQLTIIAWQIKKMEYQKGLIKERASKLSVPNDWRLGNQILVSKNKYSKLVHVSNKSV